MTGVLITRPIKEAVQFANRLEALGYAPTVEPMLAISPTQNLPPEGPFDAIMVTSANAFAVLQPANDFVQSLINLPCFCVGAVSADAARKAGFKNIKISNGNSVDLAHIMLSELMAGQRVLHIAAIDAVSAGRALLTAQGYAVAVWAIYQASEATSLSNKTQEQLKAGSFGAATFFSPRTAAVFSRLVQTQALEACCKSISAIGLSAAVADVLRPLPWLKLVTADAPTEVAVIAALESCRPAT